jgi:hypothetical protein
MPVRSGYWFNGFPEKTMIDWLKGNGWYPQSCVLMPVGKAIVFDLPEATETKTKMGADWIPVSSGKRPEVNERVNVTYLSYPNGIPMCGFPAYWTGSHWYWADDDEAVNVEITAWKPIEEPYNGDAPAKATESTDKADGYFIFVDNVARAFMYKHIEVAKAEKEELLRIYPDMNIRIYRVIEECKT